MNIGIGEAEAHLAGEALLQIGAGGARSLELSVEQQFALIHSALVGDESVGQRFQWNTIGSEGKLVLIARHTEIKIHAAVDWRAINI